MYIYGERNGQTYSYSDRERPQYIAILTLRSDGDADTVAVYYDCSDNPERVARAYDEARALEAAGDDVLLIESDNNDYPDTYELPVPITQLVDAA